MLTKLKDYFKGLKDLKNRMNFMENKAKSLEEAITSLNRSRKTLELKIVELDHEIRELKKLKKVTNTDFKYIGNRRKR